MATKPVVVGVDGSEESLMAVEWAAMEAKRHGLALHIVSAPAMMPRMQADRAVPATVADALRAVSERALERAVVRAEEVSSGLEISTSLLSGAPALAVAGRGTGAAMLAFAFEEAAARHHPEPVLQRRVRRSHNEDNR